MNWQERIEGLKPKNLKTTVKDNKGFLFLIFLLIATRWSVIDHYRVPTGSMIPTIEVGDMVLVNKMAYDLKLPFTDFVLTTFKEPKRGDVVVFKYPLDPSVNFVKRLIGLPGDVLDIRDGIIRINGKTVFKDPKMTADTILDHLYAEKEDVYTYQEQLEQKTYVVRRLPSFFQMTRYNMNYGGHMIVPKDSFFMMGDNRDNSADSRSWGLVPRDHVKGEAIRVTLSVSFSDNYAPQVWWKRFGQKID